MRFRPALLFLGAVLFAAVPVWADGIPQSELAKQPTGILLFDGFDRNQALSLWDSDTFFSASSDMGHDRDRRVDKDNHDPTPVPEPESLSLLLLGLAAVGFLTRARTARAGIMDTGNRRTSA
jgi:PEP-CTERM motif